MRIDMGKEMTKQRAQLEEAERKRRIEERRREKEEEDRARLALSTISWGVD